MKTLVKISMRGAVLVCFLIGFLTGVTGIQNEPTSSRLSREAISVAGGASILPEKSSSFFGESQNFASTKPAVRLESSRSHENEGKTSSEVRFETSSHENFLDASATASKHVEIIEENNIEVKPPEYVESQSSTGTSLPGEAKGAPQAPNTVEPQQPIGSVQLRQARQDTPTSSDSDRNLKPSTDVATNRQANPDIQDIITGIVKLLNGNVNVAVNTLRPHKPVQATRINNRGPPRISELPFPNDFNTPGMNPPPPPQGDHPYPFETPPTPERPSVNQLPPVPDRSPTRPATNRPWTRPFRPTNRRPIPPYKPLPPQEPTFTTNKGQTSESNNHKIDPTTSSLEDTTEEGTSKPQKFQPPLKPEKIDPETTLVLGAEIQPIPIPEYPVDSVLPIESTSKPSKEPVSHAKPTKETLTPTKPTKDLPNSSKPSKEVSKPQKDPSKDPMPSKPNISTLKIETSSSVQVIEPTRTTIEIQPSIVPLENNSEDTTITKTTLEPSRSPESSVIDHQSTPTEGLPVSSSKPTLEGSVHRVLATNTYHKPQLTAGNNYPYRPRPGIVLDDTLDYTKTPAFATQRPFAPPRHPQIGDIFDVTVSAIQGPGGASGENVRVSVNPNPGEDIILTSAVEGQGFVSIDGKRTHLNLFDNAPETIPPTQIQVTRTQNPVVGTGYAVPQPDAPVSGLVSGRPYAPTRRPTYFRKPTTDHVRIDTCIVGDSSTCDAGQHEACATVQGVSACHCKPGYSRLIRTLPCKKVVSIVVSIRVDRIYDREVKWNNDFLDKNSETYQELAYESNKAIKSAMWMTPFSDEYMDSSINSVYQGDVSQGQGGVFVNATLKLTLEARTARPSLAAELQKHLLGVIHRRNNNLGDSAVFVNTPAGAISNLQDLDECASSELNDCHSSAVCTNTWGAFTCSCKAGLKDVHKDDPEKAGRNCVSCPASHCNNRGTCSFEGNVEKCSCTGNYYGVKCEIDGEVMAVAIGASVAALIIIILTLVCLVMWSRRWSREQKAVGSPVYGYMQGGMPGTLPNTLARVGSVGTLASVKQGPPSNMPPYLWGHLGEHMATANLYASEPMGPTRPSSAVFGYPTMSVHGTLPPVPLPRLSAPPRSRPRHHQPEPDSSDSEPQDKDRADLIPQSSGFHVPRPKSRSSLANQSGIYYDVEYDQGDAHHLSKNNIPMSTYSMARPYYRT